VRRAPLQILFHGLIVALIGLVCGIPYGQAITGGWGAEAVRAWRLAHLGLVTGGIWLMVVASVTSLLVLSRRLAAIHVGSFVASGYGLVVALVVGAAAGVRGLEPTGPALNGLAFVANTLSALGSLAGVGIMLVGARAALRAAGRP
jgi:hypothetical protein